MKKIYIQPTTKVVEIEVQARLLIESVKSYGLDEPLKYDDDDDEGDAEDEGV